MANARNALFCKSASRVIRVAPVKRKHGCGPTAGFAGEHGTKGGKSPWFLRARSLVSSGHASLLRWRHDALNTGRTLLALETARLFDAACAFAQLWAASHVWQMPCPCHSGCQRWRLWALRHRDEQNR
jgi:hypothetical protein